MEAEAAAAPDSVSGTALAWFGQARASYRAAERAMGEPVERTIAIGPHTLRLRFAGTAMERKLFPALEHLRQPDVGPANLTVSIWDNASTGTALPPPPWSGEDYGRQGQVLGYNDGRFHTNFDVGSGMLSLCDTESGEALIWCRDAQELPYYQLGAPLRVVLGWWLATRGIQLVHAGAVGTNEGGVLLVGKGGSGKSTAALATLASDLNYASDDYCAVVTTPRPYVYSLYNTGKVNADNIGRIPPEASAAIVNRSDLASEKALLFVQTAFPHKVSRGFPIRAILLPRVTGRPRSTLVSTTGAAALQALAPSSLFGRPGSESSAFQAMGALVRQVPAYVLELGDDVPALPHLIQHLIQNGDPA